VPGDIPPTPEPKVILDRSEPEIFKKVPFSSRQWVLIGLALLAGILLLIVLVMLALLAG
jgi:hypothetical protein